MENVTVKILTFWLSDYGDIRCNASIFINNKEKANIIASFDRESYPDWKNSQNEYKEEIKANLDSYLSLPKLSKCSNLLKEIYDTVCESDASMCHITSEDWVEFYADRYTKKDFDKLKEEVKQYKLDDVISIDDGYYKIIGWGNLETSFNDDRNFAKDKGLER